LGLGDHPQQVDAQNPAVHHQHVLREFVFLFDPLGHSDAEAVIREEDRSDPRIMMSGE